MEDRKPGHIYAFTREDGESHIKIGYTTDSVTSRMAGWRKSCNYEPIILRGSESKVPNAKRIETLIHMDLELRSLRRREAWCRTNKKCRRSHGEWFEISISQAEAAIEYWISWMQTHTPYKENGQLDERCIVTMHFPPILHESDTSAPRFTSDSSARPWFGAKGESGTSDVLATRLKLLGDGKTGLKGRRTSSEPGVADDFPSSQKFPSTPRRTEPFCESKSEPSFPFSTMLYPTEGHSAIDTPSKPSLARESNPSTPRSTAISGGSSTAEVPKSNSGEKLLESRQVPHETLDEDLAADPSPLALATGDYLVGSRQYPIPIDSDTDGPQSLSRKTRPSPAALGSANTLHVKHEANAAGPTPTLRIPGQDRRRRRRSAPSTSAGESSSAASKAKPGTQTPAFGPSEEWACSRCTYKNPVFSPRCEMCQHVEPGFAAVEDIDLPPLNHGPPGRKRRPHILEQMPASDPVVPLARDLGDEGVDEMPKPSRRARGKVRRRSDKDIRTRRGEESS
jgi:T5orf172 domain